jgi:hypothetical protein
MTDNRSSIPVQDRAKEVRDWMVAERHAGRIVDEYTVWSFITSHWKSISTETAERVLNEAMRLDEEQTKAMGEFRSFALRKGVDLEHLDDADILASLRRLASAGALDAVRED